MLRSRVELFEGRRLEMLNAEPTERAQGWSIAWRCLQFVRCGPSHQLMIALVKFLGARRFTYAHTRPPANAEVHAAIAPAVYLEMEMPASQREDHGGRLAHSAILPQGSSVQSSVSSAVIAASSLRMSHNTRP